MKISTTLVVILLAGMSVSAEEELTPYTPEEVELFLQSFKKTYKNKKTPQDDAVAVLEDLEKAHKYISSRAAKGEASKEELSAKAKIVKLIALGLKARKREHVTLKCAQVLGALGERSGAKAFLKWMDNKVLDAKSANPNFVESGFSSRRAWVWPNV